MGGEIVFPEGFIELLKASVGPAEKVLEALRQAPSVSIRLNPSKLRSCPFPEAREVPWSPFGYLLKERPVFTLDPLFHAGCYYVQDTSAMFVGHVFRQLLPLLEPGATVLDLCAAPGGKSTDLAASLRECWGDAFSLLANEVMRNRFGVLRSNLDTWGDPRTGCVSRDPSAFGDSPLFDVVVADVPCSGEGMFRKDAQAVAEWSLQTVEFCAARSRRILRDIWPTLKPGGFLVYSTCTFNHFENDDTVEWIASELGADILPPKDFPPAVTTRCGQVLLPGLVPGEGQYVAALRKHGEPSALRQADVFRLFQAQRPLPPESEAQRVEVDRETALHYLHGDAVVLPAEAPLGPVTLCFQGQPLGPGKNLGKRCNNLYPKAKRIKMDIR
jgi:16S rRNA C967 or C1407 C5-methylase (RsmB/RsmF family)